MIEELYFSVVDCRHLKRLKSIVSNLTCLDNIELSSTSGTVYVWGVWDIYPSSDVWRPPILSGTAESTDEVSNIAEQYGLEGEIIYDNKHHLNEQLHNLVVREGILVSRQKKAKNYAIGVWSNTFEYLCCKEPIYLNENVLQADLSELTLKISKGNTFSYMYNGDYIKNHIRKREAIKRLNTPPKESSEPILIEFIYADHLECYSTSKTLWQKHRIIKKTDSHIFIDKYPFCGTSYLRQGWQSRVVYSIMLNRKELDANDECYHKSLRMHFYTKKSAKKKTRAFFKRENFENDAIYEVPVNAVQWALNLLDIKKWPATNDIVKKAFRIAAMKHHPDRGGSAELFIKCKTAQEFLITKAI